MIILRPRPFTPLWFGVDTLARPGVTAADPLLMDDLLVLLVSVHYIVIHVKVVFVARRVQRRVARIQIALK